MKAILPSVVPLVASEERDVRAGRSASRMTDDEIAAFHESAHAVFAVFGNWTKLAGPVALKGPGHGDVVMSTDTGAIRRSIEADPGFDRDLPRIELVRSLLAGPIAERILAESGRAELDEEELRSASDGDYAIVAKQLEQLKRGRPGLLPRLEREVRDRLEQPAVRSAVERLAAILIERRRLEADEASSLLESMRAQSPIEAFPSRERSLNRWWAALLRFLHNFSF